MNAERNPNEELNQLKQQVEKLQQELAALNARRALEAAKQTGEAQLIQAATEALSNQATAQLNLIKTQIALDTAKQTHETQLTKAVADALKNQVAAQFSLEAEKAKAPFAELSGIKAAISGMQLPMGKSGTFQLTAGTDGTALLRSKRAMLVLLDSVAEKLCQSYTEGAVVVTEEQLEQAYQAGFIYQRIDEQTSSLNQATANAVPPKPEAQPKLEAQPMAVLSAAMTAAYSAGMILDTVNSLGKLFRVDRKADIFAADVEAGEMLGYLLEAKNEKFVAEPALMNKQVFVGARDLLSKLTTLLNKIQAGTDRLTELKRVEDEEKTTKPVQSQLPDAAKVTELNAQLISAKSLLESLDPSNKPEDFWTQVKGLLIGAAIKDRDRLLIQVKGQALQITESRWFRSDRIMTSGEIQIAYRVLGKDGALKKSEVILKASKAEEIEFYDMSEAVFPSG